MSRVLLACVVSLWSFSVLANPDFEALKRFPAREVAFRTMERDVYAMSSDEQGAAARARVAALPPERRRLFWLLFLNQNLGRDGLHTFFFLDGGDFASEVQAALEAAGLKERTRVFAAAMDAFGPTYPSAGEGRKRAFAFSTSSRAPLTMLDRALMALAEAFGDSAALEADIDAYIAATPPLRDWVETERPRVSESDRLAYLTRRLTVQDDSREALAWLDPYRRLFFLDLFNKEMLNGGVHQFFANSSGDVAPEVAAALREAGLPRHSAAVETGMRLFGEPYPRQQGRRDERLFPNGEPTELDRALEALVGEVDDGEIPAAMLEIARRADALPR